MSQTFRGRLCVTREEFRKNGRLHSVGHCRLQVPAMAVEAIGLTIGDQYRAYNGGDGVVAIRKAKAVNKYDRYVIKAPEVIRLEPMHVLYIEGTRAGVASRDYPLSDIELTIEGGSILFNVPADLPKIRKANPETAKEKVAHEDRQDLTEIRTLYKGAAYALALDASRLGLKDKPVEQDQLITMLRYAGHRLAQLSPRLWKLDEKTVTLPDLVERARKIDNDMVLVAEAA